MLALVAVVVTAAEISDPALRGCCCNELPL